MAARGGYGGGPVPYSFAGEFARPSLSRGRKSTFLIMVFLCMNPVLGRRFSYLETVGPDAFIDSVVAARAGWGGGPVNCSTESFPAAHAGCH